MGARKERRACAIKVDREIFWLVYECLLWKDLHSTSITIASRINVKRRMYIRWCFVFCIYYRILQYWPLSLFLSLVYYPCANPVVSLVSGDEAFASGGAGKGFNLGANLPGTLIKYISKLLHLFRLSLSRCFVVFYFLGIRIPFSIIRILRSNSSFLLTLARFKNSPLSSHKSCQQ